VTRSTFIANPRIKPHHKGTGDDHSDSDFRCCSRFSSSVSRALISNMPSGNRMLHLPGGQIHTGQIGFCERNLVGGVTACPPTCPARSARALRPPELHIFTVPISRSPSNTRQPGQIADVGPARLEFSSFAQRNLQFATQQSFRVRNRIHILNFSTRWPLWGHNCSTCNCRRVPDSSSANRRMPSTTGPEHPSAARQPLRRAGPAFSGHELR